MKKTKLDNKARAVIIKVMKQRIQKLKKEQDRLFSKVSKQLGIPEDKKPQSDILFDVLFNNYLTPKEAVKRIQWEWTAVTAENQLTLKP